MLALQDVKLAYLAPAQSNEVRSSVRYRTVNGEEAIQKVRCGDYGLILMDMQMPLMDGMETTRAIRQLPETAHIPILAVTTNTFGADHDRCLEAGMNACVGKPIEPDALYAAVLQWLQKIDNPT